MAGQKFQYDESGGTFFYFLLSFLALILIPTTLYYWPRKKKEDPDKYKNECQCSGCTKKRVLIANSEPYKNVKSFGIKFSIIIGWMVLAYLTYRVSQFDYEMSNFDPYEILGIPMGTSQSDIKKAYRKLSLLLHPDKETGDEKAFMKLSKAYQALTDDEARKNWEQYGNPDGPGAMSFGIALPSWIVEKENSVWVLGLYALVFMVALPVTVGTWWYRSIRFSGDKVLLDTTQMYFYFFHKTPQMALKRVIMILAASLEFDKRHNSQVTERPSDNDEVPQLIRQLPNLNEKSKEMPLSRMYSLKTRALLHAHLSRIQLNPDTLDKDRQFVVQKCPYLIQEMVSCVNQLIMLAYARRIAKLPSIETIENCMKLSPMVLQGLWETKSPFLQLPFITDDHLRMFMTKKRNIKNLQQFAQLKPDESRHVLKHLSDFEYENVIRVLGKMPLIDFSIRCEVIDDENTNVVTAGAIVTVTVTLVRHNMSNLFGDTNAVEKQGINDDENAVILEENGEGGGGGGDVGNVEPSTEVGGNSTTNSATVGLTGETKVKRSPWAPTVKKSSQNKGGAKNKARGVVNKQKVQAANKAAAAAAATTTVPSASAGSGGGGENIGSNSKENGSDVDSSAEYSDNEDNMNEGGGGGGGGGSSDDENGKKHASAAEDDDVEWEKFQQKLNKREKLEGKSKMSHSVHCPNFPEDKQEYWWTYICDRRSRTLLTAPYHVTNLVEAEEIQLKFTAPRWPGVYTFTVCLRSDSYIGMDQQQELKLDVKEAPAIPTDHPQWDISESESEKDDPQANESEFTTDTSDEDE